MKRKTICTWRRSEKLKIVYLLLAVMFIQQFKVNLECTFNVIAELKVYASRETQLYLG